MGKNKFGHTYLVMWISLYNLLFVCIYTKTHICDIFTFYECNFLVISVLLNSLIPNQNIWLSFRYSSLYAWHIYCILNQILPPIKRQKNFFKIWIWNLWSASFKRVLLFIVKVQSEWYWKSISTKSSLLLIFWTKKQIYFCRILFLYFHKPLPTFLIIYINTESKQILSYFFIYYVSFFPFLLACYQEITVVESMQSARAQKGLVS